jgi:hypothetical protein
VTAIDANRDELIRAAHAVIDDCDTPWGGRCICERVIDAILPIIERSRANNLINVRVERVDGREAEVYTDSRYDRPTTASLLRQIADDYERGAS